MANIRDWLDRAAFDWATGSVVFHLTGEPECGNAEAGASHGWRTAIDAVCVAGEAARTYDLTCTEFDAGYGAPCCPRFIAQDKDRIFFPGQHDGATWLEFIYKDLNVYLDFANRETPYIGG